MMPLSTYNLSPHLFAFSQLRQNDMNVISLQFSLLAEQDAPFKGTESPFRALFSITFV